jgi:hypothetical protein
MSTSCDYRIHDLPVRFEDRCRNFRVVIIKMSDRKLIVDPRSSEFLDNDAVDTAEVLAH